MAIRLSATKHLPDWLVWFLRRNRFRYVRRRTGSFDYLCEFNHRDIGKAKGSILWDAPWNEETAATLQILRQMDLLHDGQTVLDYGCGIGRISRALAEEYRIHVIAVERSYWMRKHFVDYFSEKDFLRRSLSSGTVRLWSDVEFLQNVPAVDGKVDLILLIAVLHHIPEPILDQLLPQIVRALAPKGKLFVFGNRVLDVDSSGAICTAPIKAYLGKHTALLRIIREDVWERTQIGEYCYRFASPRYSFLAFKLD